MADTLHAINNATLNASVVPHVQPSTKAAAPAPQPKTLDPKNAVSKPHVVEDKVTLSASAQARLLLQQGRSVSQIAAALSTTPATVDSYLGITQNTVTLVPATTHPVSLPVGASAGVPEQRSFSAVA